MRGYVFCSFDEKPEKLALKPLSGFLPVWAGLSVWRGCIIGCV